MVEVKVDDERCDGCGICMSVCPVSVFETKKEKCHVVNSDECLVCRACEVQCSNGLIDIIE